MKKIQTDKEGFEIRYCNDLEEWTRISPCCKQMFLVTGKVELVAESVMHH